MKVFVTGATGVLGCAAVTSLVADGHDVHGIARDDTKAAALEAAGAVPVQAQLLEVDAMTAAFDGFDAVCNLATHVPVGVAGLRPGAWKSTTGSASRAPVWSRRRRGLPAYAGWCKRASRSCTPTVVTTGSRRRARSL